MTSHDVEYAPLTDEERGRIRDTLESAVTAHNGFDSPLSHVEREIGGILASIRDDRQCARDGRILFNQVRALASGSDEPQAWSELEAEWNALSLDQKIQYGRALKLLRSPTPNFGDRVAGAVADFLAAMDQVEDSPDQFKPHLAYGA